MFPHPNSNQMVFMPSPRPTMLAKERVGDWRGRRLPGLLRPPRTSNQLMLLTWSADGGLAPVQHQKNKPDSLTAQPKTHRPPDAPGGCVGWMCQQRLRRRRLEKAALAL